MEQKTNFYISTENLENASNSPPQKKAKRQPDENPQQLEATRINAAKTDDHLIGAEHLFIHQLMNSDDSVNHQT